MISHILLDNDGVLTDTEILAYRALKDVFASQGIELPIETYVDNCVKSANGVYHLLRERGIAEEQINRLRAERDKLLTKLLNTESIVIPHVEESLILLKKHFQLHIVTSSHREHFLTMHKRTGYLKYFTNITTEEDFKNRKPAPDGYLKSMNDIGAKPDECIVFEDSERGLKAAVSAGIKCIVIPTDLTKYQDFKTAWKIADSFKAATEYVLEYNRMYL